MLRKIKIRLNFQNFDANQALSITIAFKFLNDENELHDTVEFQDA